ncbi:hypothetical protein AbraIFM66950_005321 [Aspergillus brasiliensis]|nr:hypothetical protein AbraIFM66950_005321 [Aspergillus brasiliensis]
MATAQQTNIWATLTTFFFLMNVTSTSGADTGWITAALLVGINAIVQTHSGNGQTGAVIRTKQDDGLIAFSHITPQGVFHDFINTTALNYDRHFVQAVNQPVKMKIRWLSDGRIHALHQ